MAGIEGMEGIVKLGRCSSRVMEMLERLGRRELKLRHSPDRVVVIPSPSAVAADIRRDLRDLGKGRLRRCQRAWLVSTTFFLQLLLHTIASKKMLATPAT